MENLSGVGIVEVNPYLDHAELIQHIAVQLLLEAIASAVQVTISETEIK